MITQKTLNMRYKLTLVSFAVSFFSFFVYVWIDEPLFLIPVIFSFILSIASLIIYRKIRNSGIKKDDFGV